MILYGLRLLVALLTFSFGVAAAWVLGSAPSKNCKLELGSRTSTAVKTVTVMTEAPKPRSCWLDRDRLVQGGPLQNKSISKPQPDYPPAAKAARVGGTVVVAVALDTSGRVESAEAISGPELLRDAAVEAARKARFSPTLLSGQPAKVSGTITYNFVLP